MRFDVRAIAPDSVVRLSIEANDEQDARRQVAVRGMYASEVSPAVGRRARSGGPRNWSLVLFSQELLALLGAGLSLVEGLEALLEKEAGDGARMLLERLLLGLREGKRFSVVLAEQGGRFPPLYVGIVRAAEGTSDLPRSLARYVDYQQRIDGVRGRLVSASIYPAILMVVGGSVASFLICYVVPRFAMVYQDAGRELPWASRVLLAWGGFASAHALPLMLCIGATLAAVVFGVRRAIARGGVGQLLAMVPGVEERVRIYDLSRLYLTLGMLLEGGITVVSAIETTLAMVSTDLRTRLRAACLAIESGAPLSAAFERNRLTTPVSLRMLRVGERSGELGAMLTRSAAFYDGEITRWVDRFTRTFEPLLMACIGLVVGAIVVLLYMPIFDLAQSLS
jgi:general secretion pathway protein F